MNEALWMRLDGFEYEELAAAQAQLLVFQPIITHSVTEATSFIRIHIQMLSDFNTLEELAYKMLDELRASGA
jgi:hypothetical protein